MFEQKCLWTCTMTVAEQAIAVAVEISGAVQTTAEQVAAETAEISGAAQTVAEQATAGAAEISGAAQPVAEQATAVAAKISSATAATELLARPGFAGSDRYRQMFGGPKTDVMAAKTEATVTKSDSWREWHERLETKHPGMLVGRTPKRSVKVGAMEGMWWHVANAAMKQLHHLAPAVGDAPAHEMAYSVLTEIRRAQHSNSQVKLKLQSARWKML